MYRHYLLKTVYICILILALCGCTSVNSGSPSQLQASSPAVESGAAQHQSEPAAEPVLTEEQREQLGQAQEIFAEWHARCGKAKQAAYGYVEVDFENPVSMEDLYGELSSYARVTSPEYPDLAAIESAIQNAYTEKGWAADGGADINVYYKEVDGVLYSILADTPYSSVYGGSVLEVLEWTDDTLSVRVNGELQDDMAPDSIPPEVLLSFVKEDDIWKLDGIQVLQ